MSKSQTIEKLAGQYAIDSDQQIVQSSISSVDAHIVPGANPLANANNHPIEEHTESRNQKKSVSDQLNKGEVPVHSSGKGECSPLSAAGAVTVAGGTGRTAAGNVTATVNKILSAIAKVVDEIIRPLTPILRLFGVDVELFREFLKQISRVIFQAIAVAAVFFAISIFFSSLTAALCCGVVFLIAVSWSRANAALVKADLEKSEKELIEQRGDLEKANESCGAVKQKNEELAKCIDEEKATNERLLKANAEVNENCINKEKIINEQKEATDALNGCVKDQAREIQTQNEQMQAQALLMKAKEDQILANEQLIGDQTQQIQAQNVRIEEQNKSIEARDAVLRSMLVSQNSAVTQLSTMLESQSKTINGVLSNIQSLANGEQSLTEALQKAQHEVVEIQKTIAQIIGLSSTDGVSKLEPQQIQERFAEINVLSADVNEKITTMITNLTANIIAAQRKIADARAKAEDSIKRLVDKNGKLQDTVKKLEENLKESENKLKQLQQDYEDGKRNFENLQRQHEEQKRLLEEKQKESALAADNLKEESKRARAALEAQKIEFMKSEQKLSSAKDNLVKMDEAVKTVIRTNEELKQKLEEEKTLNERINRELKEQKLAFENNKKIILEQGAEIAKLGDKLHTVTVQNDSLVEIIRDAQRHASGGGGGMAFAAGLATGVLGVGAVRAAGSVLFGGK
jgi:chromosome segregation ATPase